MGPKSTSTSILPFWEDLLTGSSDNEAVFWVLTGQDDNQVLTIQWNDVRLDGTERPVTISMKILVGRPVLERGSVTRVSWDPRS